MNRSRELSQTLSGSSVPPLGSSQRPATVVGSAIASSAVMNEEYTGGSSEEDTQNLVKSLRDNKGKPEQLRPKLHRLRNIGDHVNARSLYEVKELMELYQSDSRVMAACCGAVWGVCAANEEKYAEAAESGAIRTIVDALRNPATQKDADFVQWAFGALATLARGNDNRRRIADAGAIEAILDAWNLNKDSAGVFEWASRVLHALVHRYEEEGEADAGTIRTNITTIDEGDGIPIIVSSIRQHANEAIPAMWAVNLLWRLQDRDGSEALSMRVIEKIIKAGGVTACVKVLKARSTLAAVFCVTAELLVNLLTVAGNDGLEEAAECMVTTIRVMSSFADDPSVQEASCNLLTLLVSTNRLQFKESGGLKAVVNAMTNFPDTLSLQRAAATALWAISYIPAFFDLAYLSDALNAVEAANTMNSNDVELLIPSCGFIANAAAISSTSASDLPYRIALNAITLESDNADLTNQAGRALGNCCIQHPQLTRRVLAEDNCLEGLVNCLKSESSQVLQSVYGSLIAIADVSDENKKKLVDAGCFDVAKAQIQRSASVGLTEKALELLSVLASSEKRTGLPVPIDIFQVIMQSMRSQFTSSQSLEQACGVMRNLMVATTGGSTLINFDGLVDHLTDLVNKASNAVGLKREACGVIWAYTARHPKQSEADLTKMFKSVVGVTGMYKGEQQQYNSDLQSVAAGALAAITGCMRDVPIDIALEEAEGIISVIYMAMDYDLERTELLEKFLDSILNLSFVNEALVIQCGGIVVVIDAMVEHEQCEPIQERGCAILALLSSTENLQVNLCIAETDGIDLIVSALAVFPTNHRIQVDACKALSHLSVDHESRMLIASQGGLMLIVNAVESNQDNVDLLEGACAALLNLSSDAEEQVLSDSNVVETVISIIRDNPDAMRLQEKALGVLQNVSMRNANAKAAIAQAGGINAVTVAIKEYMGTASVLERAFTTLWSLAVLERNQIEIANAGGIGLVVNGMLANIEHAKVQKQACGCLCTLSSNSRNKSLIREAGGVDAIVYAMWAHYDSEVLQIEACRALSSLAVNVQTNEVMIATDGEINAIISAMRLFPDSAKLQEHACVALRNFMLSADNVELIRYNAEELRHLMKRAATQFPQKCSERANQVLACL